MLIAAARTWRAAMSAALADYHTESTAAYTDAAVDYVEAHADEFTAAAAALFTATIAIGQSHSLASTLSGLTYTNARFNAAADWYSATGTAAAAHDAAISGYDTTLYSSAAAAFATHDTTGQSTYRDLTNGRTSLNRTLNTTLLANAVTWSGTVVDAGVTADNASTDASSRLALDKSAAAQTLQSALWGSTKDFTAARAGAKRTLAADVGRIVTAWGDTGAASEGSVAGEPIDLSGRDWDGDGYPDDLPLPGVPIPDDLPADDFSPDYSLDHLPTLLDYLEGRANAATPTDRAILAIRSGLPPIISSGTETCGRYEMVLEDYIRGLGNPAIVDIRVAAFAISPWPDGPWEAQLGLTTGHAAVQVTFADGRIVYFDNTGFGGVDQMFSREEIPRFAYRGVPTDNLLHYLFSD